MPNWKSVIKPNTVTIFSASYCPYCREVAAVLDTIEVEYNKVECDQAWNEADRNTLKTQSGHNTWPNVFIGDEHIGGCSDVKAKINNGSLFPILDKFGISYER